MEIFSDNYQVLSSMCVRMVNTYICPVISSPAIQQCKQRGKESLSFGQGSSEN